MGRPIAYTPNELRRGFQERAQHTRVEPPAQRVALRPELLKWLGDTLMHHSMTALMPKLEAVKDKKGKITDVKIISPVYMIAT